jgi:hypothetical protein
MTTKCFTMKDLLKTNKILLIVIGIHFLPLTSRSQHTYSFSAGYGIWSESLFNSYPMELNGFIPEMSPSLLIEVSRRQTKNKNWFVETGISYQSVHSTLLVSELTDPYNINVNSHFGGLFVGAGYSNPEFHRKGYLSFSGNVFIQSSLSSGVYEDIGGAQEKVLNLYEGNFSEGIFYGIEPKFSYNYLLDGRRKNVLFCEVAFRTYLPNGTSDKVLMLTNLKLGYRLRFK